MYNADTDLIFPPRVIPSLRNERGTAWMKLVTAVENAAADSPEMLAFVLMMARLSACTTCNADSYRAAQGCMICSKQVVKRFRGTDDELVRLFKTAIKEVEKYIQTKT